MNKNYFIFLPQEDDPIRRWHLLIKNEGVGGAGCWVVRKQRTEVKSYNILYWMQVAGEAPVESEIIFRMQINAHTLFVYCTVYGVPATMLPCSG